MFLRIEVSGHTDGIKEEIAIVHISSIIDRPDSWVALFFDERGGMYGKSEFSLECADASWERIAMRALMAKNADALSNEPCVEQWQTEDVVPQMSINEDWMVWND